MQKKFYKIISDPCLCLQLYCLIFHILTLERNTHVTRQMQESAAEKMGNFMAQVM